MTSNSHRSILDKVKVKRGVKIGTVGTDYVRPTLDECPEMTQSFQVADFIRPLWQGMDHYESFAVLFLSRGMRCVGYDFISRGGVSGTVADPKLIYQKALAANASGIILAHNHPSGSTTPSQADLQLTKKLKEAGKYLEIEVIDHLILTSNNSYTSFANEGLM